MIIDTSALVAMVRNESDAARYRDVLVSADRRAISAGSVLEANIVVQRLRQPELARRIQRLLDEFEVEVEPVDADQAEVGRQAYRDFGRGSGHPAHLNFGDCFAYALATVTGEPLLFKGDGFNHTDIRLAPVGE